MGNLRTFLRDHHRLAAWLIAMALCMKALVPAGYMIGTQAKVFTIEICSDSTGQHLTSQIVVPQNGKPADSRGEQAKGDNPCPYSSLAMASLSGADSALLALALAFILALGFAPVRVPALQSPFHLRPPLRGPPALA